MKLGLFNLASHFLSVTLYIWEIVSSRRFSVSCHQSIHSIGYQLTIRHVHCATGSNCHKYITYLDMHHKNCFRSTQLSHYKPNWRQQWSPSRGLTSNQSTVQYRPISSSGGGGSSSSTSVVVHCLKKFPPYFRPQVTTSTFVNRWYSFQQAIHYRQCATRRFIVNPSNCTAVLCKVAKKLGLLPSAERKISS